MPSIWRCTRHSEKCFSTKDLDWEGWLGFAVLVGAHLLIDVINGGRMIVSLSLPVGE